MIDRREQILERLMVILAAVPTVQVVLRNVVRNRGELPPEMRPAITLLDGDEVTSLSSTQQRGKVVPPMTKVEMSPEINVVMDAREPDNKLIGEDMNAMRTQIVKAIYDDTALAGILTTNGEMKYVGCQTDMATGRTMEGTLHIQMTFTYPLMPKDL
jgi:hypothetical protein